MSLAALLSGVLNSPIASPRGRRCSDPPQRDVDRRIARGVNAAGWGDDARTGYALVAGVFIAGVAQFALLWIAAARAGLALRLRTAAPVAGCAPADPPRGSGADRRRHHPVQSADRHPDRLRFRSRGILSLLRRPHLPVAAGRGRRRHRRRAAAGPVAQASGATTAGMRSSARTGPSSSRFSSPSPRPSPSLPRPIPSSAPFSSTAPSPARDSYATSTALTAFAVGLAGLCHDQGVRARASSPARIRGRR